MPWWCAAFVLPQLAGAATVTWLGGTGRFKEPRFWDTGAVPTTTDTVIIRTGTVYLTEDRTVASLEVTDSGNGAAAPCRAEVTYILERPRSYLTASSRCGRAS